MILLIKKTYIKELSTNIYPVSYTHLDVYKRQTEIRENTDWTGHLEMKEQNRCKNNTWRFTWLGKRPLKKQCNHKTIHKEEDPEQDK